MIFVAPREARDSGTLTSYAALTQDRFPEVHAPALIPDPIRETVAMGPYGQRRPMQQIAFYDAWYPWEYDGFIQPKIAQASPLASTPDGRLWAYRERYNMDIPPETSYGQLVSFIRSRLGMA